MNNNNKNTLELEISWSTLIMFQRTIFVRWHIAFVAIERRFSWTLSYIRCHFWNKSSQLYALVIQFNEMTFAQMRTINSLHSFVCHVQIKHFSIWKIELNKKRSAIQSIFNALTNVNQNIWNIWLGVNHVKWLFNNSIYNRTNWNWEFLCKLNGKESQHESSVCGVWTK